MPFGIYNGDGRGSSESAHPAAVMDRWGLRRLQRLNTEQELHGRRQIPAGQQSPASSTYSNNNGQTQNSSAASSEQPFSAAAWDSPSPAYHSARTSHPTSGLGVVQHHPPLSPSTTTRFHNNYTTSAATAHLGSNPYAASSSGSVAPYLSSPAHIASSPSSLQHSPLDPPRPPLSSSRASSLAHQLPLEAATSMSASNPSGNSGSISNSGGLAAPKPVRSAGPGGSSAGPANRQSMHNGMGSRETSSLPGHGTSQGGSTHGSSASANVAGSKGLAGGETARGATPQPPPSAEDMSAEEVTQLLKDHKELREKYTKVKKYYFEKEDQVKQLQNSLAHQRLSQSRTSLDDSEYATRFNRLDGLVKQLAYNIRKEWRSVPSWLHGSVNKDAIVTGKQEMTAVGRAAISCWLVEEVFDKYFHPDLELTLSTQLKHIQRNIRRFAPMSPSSEEEELLTSKVVNWRLATLEGLQETLRSPQCATQRAELTDTLKEQLCNVIAVHLHDPPPPDLEGGVNMIVELVVGIAAHLPLESRDVAIEYFMPGDNIAPEHMNLDSSIPPLATSIADEAAEHASTQSAASDDADNIDPAPPAATKKRGMLSALTGVGGGGGGGSVKSKPAQEPRSSPQGKHGGSSSSLNRPESAHGAKDQPPRVRIAAGVSVRIRGRSVLFKAPVYTTA